MKHQDDLRNQEFSDSEAEVFDQAKCQFDLLEEILEDIWWHFG